MDYNELLEPEKLYKTQLKDKFHDNAEKYFAGLMTEAAVNTEANRLTCDKLYEYIKQIEKLKSSRRSKKALMVTLIVFGAIFLAVGLLFIFLYASQTLKEWYFLLIGIILVVLGLCGIILPIVFILPKIKSLDEQIAKLQALANQEKETAYGQMASLNRLYDWGIPAKLVTATTPLIQMDPTFNPNRFYNLNEKYGFKENDDISVSSVYVQSGTILGNPFLMERNYCTELRDYTYTGSIVIHWTTTYSDKNGVHTQHHSQTLTAYVTKPKPEYWYDTWLVYGNDAAPRLSFLRKPSNANKMDEKELEKFVRKTEKELQNMHEKNITKSNFTPLANAEFEGLFHAYDRDNETEFRLLFTPLGQKSMLQLIESKEPYGDDFIFQKKKCLNYIKSKHSQTANYDGDPRHFYHYDHRVARKLFVDYMDEFFKGFFYDLAPLLCIPLYQQHKAIDYIYKDVFPRNVTSFETEVLANQYDPKVFAPEECKTDVILKAELIKKQGEADLVNIHAYGYDKIKHITLVPKLGGDGRWHDVPVEWYEYIECDKVTPMGIQNFNYTKKTYQDNLDKLQALLAPFTLGSGIITQRGIISSVLKEDAGLWNSKELNNIFSHKEEN